jgi:hypothetical protein
MAVIIAVGYAGGHMGRTPHSCYYIGRFEVSSDVLRGVLTVTFYAGPFSS